jgi:hypothetical protein
VPHDHCAAARNYAQEMHRARTRRARDNFLYGLNGTTMPTPSRPLPRSPRRRRQSRDPPRRSPRPHAHHHTSPTPKELVRAARNRRRAVPRKLAPPSSLAIYLVVQAVCRAAAADCRLVTGRSWAYQWSDNSGNYDFLLWVVVRALLGHLESVAQRQDRTSASRRLRRSVRWD